MIQFVIPPLFAQVIKNKKSDKKQSPKREKVYRRPCVEKEFIDLSVDTPEIEGDHEIQIKGDKFENYCKEIEIKRPKASPDFEIYGRIFDKVDKSPDKAFDGAIGHIRQPLEGVQGLAFFPVVGVCRFQIPSEQQPYKKDSGKKNQQRIGKIIQPVADCGEIGEKVVFVCPKPPISEPLAFEVVEVVGNGNGRSGNGRNGRGEIEERDFRIVVDGGGYVVFDLKNLTEIISDRQAEIPNTLDNSTEGVREEEYTRDKAERYRYGYVVPIINPFHTSQPVNTK